MTPLRLGLVVLALGLVSGDHDHDRAVGHEFIVVFMENPNSGSRQSPNLQLLATSVDDEAFTLTVTSPSLPSTITETVLGTEVKEIDLPPSLRMQGTGRAQKGVFITATKDLSLYGLNRNVLSTDAFLALPVDLLGNEYFAVTYGDPSTASEIGIAIPHDGTRVIVRFDGEADVTVTFDGTDYNKGDRLVIENLDRLDTVQLQCAKHCDLTGTFIQGSKPIAVFGGNAKTAIPSNAPSKDHLVEQMLPLHTWGKEYAVVASPLHDDGDFIHVLASEDDTEVSFTSTVTLRNTRILNRAQHNTWFLPANSVASIIANKPVLVTQFLRTQRFSTQPAEPSMILVPPMEQYTNTYRFSTPMAGASNIQYQNFVFVTIPASLASGLRLNGNSVSATWRPVPHTSLVGAVIQVAPETTTITHSDTEAKMGVILYGSAVGESYALPVGLLLHNLNPCTPSDMTEGDRKDNDCDFHIDEEIGDGVDNDGDGEIDEDLAGGGDRDLPDPDPTRRSIDFPDFINHGKHDRAIGHEFIVMYLENVGSEMSPDMRPPPLELFLTSSDATPFTARVQVPSVGMDMTVEVSANNVALVEISSDARMIGSTISNKGVLIQANHDFTCFGVNKNLFSVDGFLGLPTDMLGNEYYAVGYHQPTITTQLGVVGIQDGTDMSVSFIGGDNRPLSVPYGGRNYARGETLIVTLDRLDTLQLQCSDKCDLTGTYIVSSSPVAVFSGNVRTAIPTSETSRDHLMEQLIPLHTWGKEFPIQASPNRVNGDLVTALAHEENTEVTIHRFGMVPMSITLDRAEFKKWEIPSNALAFIIASKPIMVTQFLKSQVTRTSPADPSMIAVPAINQYSNSYRFSTTEGVAKTYTNYLMITIQGKLCEDDKIVKGSETDGLMLDGQPLPALNWNSVSGTDYLGATMRIEPGTHEVTHSNPDADFGLILYGAGDRESYAFPVGMKLQQFNPCIRSVDNMRILDGVDNDCDGDIDEEKCDGEDDDGDGETDEDCGATTTTTTTTTTQTTTTTTTEATTTPYETTPYFTMPPYPTTPQPEDLPLRDIYHCGVEPLHLSCDGGELIQIVQAHFGRLAYDGEMTCGQGNAREYFEDQYVDRLCGYHQHYGLISGECNRQHNCSLSPTYFRDRSPINLCPVTNLYLHITYRCISSFEYEFNELSFGGTSASSEQDGGLSSYWRTPDMCALNPFHTGHSHASCETACDSLLLRNSAHCPNHAEKCSVAGSTFHTDNLRSWCPESVETTTSFIDTDLGDVHMVRGVLLQGGRKNLCWVTQFSLWYSADGVEWLRAPTLSQVTAGNEDSHTTVLVELVFAVPARYMRLKVLEYHNHPCVHIAYIHNAAEESCPLLIVHNSDVTNVVGHHGDSVQITCDETYRTVDGLTTYEVVCGSDMHWDTVKPCSRRTCGDLPDGLAGSGQVVGSVFIATVGTDFSGGCAPELTDLGYEAWMCMPNWTWQPFAQCCDNCLHSYDEFADEDQCYRFPLAINAGIIGDVTREEDAVVTFQCAPDYCAVGPSISSCIKTPDNTYEWTNDPIVCEPCQ